MGPSKMPLILFIGTPTSPQDNDVRRHCLVVSTGDLMREAKAQMVQNSRAHTNSVEPMVLVSWLTLQESLWHVDTWQLASGIRRVPLVNWHTPETTHNACPQPLDCL